MQSVPIRKFRFYLHNLPEFICTRFTHAFQLVNILSIVLMSKDFKAKTNNTHDKIKHDLNILGQGQNTFCSNKLSTEVIRDH
jgi:hypothetical protein